MNQLEKSRQEVQAAFAKLQRQLNAIVESGKRAVARAKPAADPNAWNPSGPDEFRKNEAALQAEIVEIEREAQALGVERQKAHRQQRIFPHAKVVRLEELQHKFGQLDSERQRQAAARARR